MSMCSPDEMLQVLGRVVRELRTRLKLSQEEFASAAGFDRTYISLVERGKRNMSFLNMNKLAVALQTTPAQLLRMAEDAHRAEQRTTGK